MDIPFLSLKTQSNIFHMSQKRLYNLKSKSNTPIRRKLYLTVSIFVSFFIVLKLIYYKISSKVIIPYVELSITTKCNLKCKGCATLTNLYGEHNYKNPYEIDYKQLVDDVKTLASSTDYIYSLRLLGGETFTYKNLDVLIRELSKIQNIGLIDIVSNGVTIPKKNILTAIKENNVSVTFSEYSLYPNKTKKVLELFNNENVRYIVVSSGQWFDLGDFKFRERSTKEKLDVFNNCIPANCNSILNGKLYICPRASHGHDLGIYNFSDKNNESYVNLRENNKENIRKNITKLYSKQYFKECDYCNGSDYSMINPATQEKY